MQKILVIYYSRTGNNELLAHEFKEFFNCDIERINPYKKYYNIFSIVLNSIFKLKRRIKDIKSDLNSYDIVLICSPVWMGFIPNPVRAFIEKYKDSLRKVFFAAIDGAVIDKNPYVDEYFKSSLGGKFIKSLQLSVSEMISSTDSVKVLKYKVKKEDVIKKYEKEINEFVGLIKNT